MKKFWNGVLAFGPLGLLLFCFCSILMVLVIIFGVSMFYTMTGTDLSDAQSNFMGFLAIATFLCAEGCAFLAIPFCIADIIVFSIYAFKNPKLVPGLKTVWCCAFVSLQFVAFPVYWWIYIRKE